MRAKTLLLGVGLIAVLAFAAPADARMEAESDTLKTESKEKDGSDDELEALRRAAEAETKKEQAAEETAEERTFKSGNLGLQALNPEISVTGDMLGRYQSGNDEEPTSETRFRTLGLHFEAYLDPYSHFRAAIPISIVDAELGEAYFTRYGVAWNINLTLGKFRQQLGIVNRWHLHALDWFNFPLALRGIFGPGGLNQIGLCLDWSASTGSLVHSLWAQVTNARNPQVFGQNSDNLPSILGRYAAYHDLSPSTYVQIGLSGLVGWNNAWTTIDTAGTVANFDDTQTTVVYGIDLVLMWEPTDRMRYRNIEWRSEGYYLDKGIIAPDGSGPDQLKPWGLYSLLQAKVSRTVEIGARYDYFAPDAKDYTDESLGPLVVTEDGAYRQLFGGWLTWWQSPFVKFRGGYSYSNGKGTGNDIHIVTFQMVFAAGPHKHERY
ncbi:MAG: hypothetical protein KAJ37_02825 [Candidatus Krumholzibacteria bacterium]|nr:hypothetical protein [Candidatus Krumholzibacteria bacterium]